MGLVFLANIILKYLFFASSVDKNDNSNNLFVLNGSKFSGTSHLTVFDGYTAILINKMDNSYQDFFKFLLVESQE